MSRRAAFFAAGLAMRRGVRYAADHIAATGITNGTQQQAIRGLEADLLAAGLLDASSRADSLLQFIYPLVGGTSTAHSVNFANPAAKSINWNGSPGHTANGVTFNGINQYGDTGINANTFDPHNTHIAFYADQPISDPARGGQGVAGAGTSSAQDFILGVNRGGLSFYASAHDNALALWSQPAAVAGLVLGTRTSAALAVVYYNGQEKARSTTIDTGTMPIDSISVGVVNGTSTFSQVPCSFFSVGVGLSASQQLAYYQAIQRFQAALGRAR